MMIGDVFVEIWAILREMAPFLVFGFLVAGFMSILISRQLVERHLGHPGLWSVLKASLLGVPLPLCSCGVIPVAASIRKQGGSKGAVISFLLSTPQTGVDSLLVTYGLLAPAFGVRFALIFTVVRPFAALITGVVGGVLVSALDPEDDDVKEEAPVKSCCASQKTESRPTIREALVYGFKTLPRDIARPLLLGVLISALVSAVLPDDFFEISLMDGVLGMLIWMLCGIPLYVCATGSIPIAVSLIAKGVSPAAALTFLISGPATNAATVTTVLAMMGRRTMWIYLAVVAASALVFGGLMMFLLPATQVQASTGMDGMVPAWLELSSVGFLIVLLVPALLPRLKRKDTEQSG